MNIVNGFDIDTVEGAEAYLKSEGIDVESVKDGLDIIERTKELVLSSVSNSFPLVDKKDPNFEILFREDKNWAAHNYELTNMMREIVLRYNKIVEYLNNR